MSLTRTCPKCGAILPEQGWEGLCPKCLVRVSLEPADATEATDLSQIANPKVRYFGDYELIEEIARGGMGIVYKARQVTLNRLVALKMILSGQLASESEVQRFRTEAEAAAQLDHPNIVPIYEVGEHEGQHYFSMKFVEGDNLAQTLAGKPMPAPRAAKLLATIARAVHYAHQRGILHRDIKPTNILIDPRGEPQLTDFGLARLVEKDSSLTQSLAILGSANYMSPEQASGHARQLTTATDVYGLGAVLYETLTGRPPFQAETFVTTLRQVVERDPVSPGKVIREGALKSQVANRRSQIDRDLETICLKCLNKDPLQRYGSAEALAVDLEHWLAREPIVARPISRTAKMWRWCRRKPALAVLAASTAILLLAITIGSPIAAFRINRERRGTEQLLYAADVSLAQQALEAGNVMRASALLEAHHPKSAAADLRGFEWYYLSHLCRGDEGHTFQGHHQPVRCVAISPDGKILASCSDDQTIRLWDLASKTNLATLRGASSAITFSPDGTIFASGGADKTIKLWNVRSRELLRELTNYAGPVMCLVFTPDGKRLAVGAEGANLKLLDIQTLETVHDFGVDSEFSAVAVSPDGRYLAVSSTTFRISLWDLVTLRLV
jgi:tRNA A-37 threonylcarbamoyl transferase component Bud32